LILNGYDDWFLPSQDELELMYTNLFSANLGSLNFWHWSSSEGSSSNSWIWYMNPGGWGEESGKSLYYKVRAVRAF